MLATRMILKISSKPNYKKGVEMLMVVEKILRCIYLKMWKQRKRDWRALLIMLDYRSVAVFAFLNGC